MPRFLAPHSPLNELLQVSNFSAASSAFKSTTKLQLALFVLLVLLAVGPSRNRYDERLPLWLCQCQSLFATDRRYRAFDKQRRAVESLKKAEEVRRNSTPCAKEGDSRQRAELDAVGGWSFVSQTFDCYFCAMV